MKGKEYANTTKISQCIETVEVCKYENMENIDRFARSVEGKGHANTKSESIDVKSVIPVSE